MTAHTCENCRRDTAHDTIPAQQIGNHPIPAYTVCGFCYSCSVIAYFKDPLPADVVGETA